MSGNIKVGLWAFVMWLPRRVFLFALATLLGFALPGTSRAAGLNDSTERVQVACHSEAAREIVLLTFGQSISSNSGEAAYKPHGNAINFNHNDGHCYVATDPLLGADIREDSHVGSIWGYLCDELLATGRWDSCIIASLRQSPKVRHELPIGRREAGLII